MRRSYILGHQPLNHHTWKYPVTPQKIANNQSARGVSTRTESQTAAKPQAAAATPSNNSSD
jgi:hypothetical protein